MSAKFSIPLFFFVFFSSKSAAQDTLIFENNWRLPVLIVEENDEDVFYRKPILPNGDTYAVRKRFITDIRYQHPDSAAVRRKHSIPLAKRQLDMWLMPMDTALFLKGTLHSLNDTTLLLRKKLGLFEGYDKARTEVIYVMPFHAIKLVQIRKRNQVRDYALWGAAGGFVTGTLVGLAGFKNSAPCDTSVIDGGPCDESLHPHRSRFEKSLLLGLGTAGGGFLAGGLVGSIKVTIKIGGKKDRFNIAIPKLERQARLQGRP